MKKSLFLLSVLLFTMFFNINAYADESNFARALRTCNPYILDDSLTRNGQTFNIAVSLEKSKKKSCIYKEKIYQGIEYQMLTCDINNDNLSQIADIMEKHYQNHKQEIQKERIFEAKMTSNNELLKTFLSDPKRCNITYASKQTASTSKKK